MRSPAAAGPARHPARSSLAVELPFSSTFSAAAGCHRAAAGLESSSKDCCLRSLMLQCGALARCVGYGALALCLLALIHWKTVIMCSNSSKALAPAFKQHVISYARPFLCYEMFIPRLSGRDEMKHTAHNLRNVILCCHSIRDAGTLSRVSNDCCYRATGASLTAREATCTHRE